MPRSCSSKIVHNVSDNKCVHRDLFGSGENTKKKPVVRKIVGCGPKEKQGRIAIQMTLIYS